MRCPNWRTINYFRGKRLKAHFDTLSTQVAVLLSEQGFVSLKVQYVDGTKVESGVNKYTFVWHKSVEKNQPKLKARLAALLQKIYNRQNELYIFSKRTIHFSKKKECYVLCEIGCLTTKSDSRFR